MLANNTISIRRLRPQWFLMAIMTIFPLIMLVYADSTFVKVNGNSIVAKADQVMLNSDYIASVEMVVRREGNTDLSYKMKIASSGTDKMLVSFQYPPRNLGQSFLNANGFMLAYMPSVNKAIRISGKQSFAGGDFSNGDILYLKLTTDYSASVVGEEIMNDLSCYVLILEAISHASPYQKIKYWINKSNFWPVRRDYYAVSGSVLKTLIFSSRTSKERPDVMTMSNVLEKGKSTEMYWHDIVKKKLDASFFTEENMKRQF
jgi:outer membrane lipoprotein-sorting protein